MISGAQKRKQIKLREAAAKRQEGRCFHCNLTMKDVTAEHLLPKSKGGKVSEANIVAVCRCCNEKRRNFDLTFFYFNILLK